MVPAAGYRKLVGIQGHRHFEKGVSSWPFCPWCLYRILRQWIYIYIYIYYRHTHTYTYTYIYIYTCIYIYIYIHTRICMCIHMYMCIHTYTYIHTYIYMYLCILSSSLGHELCSSGEGWLRGLGRSLVHLARHNSAQLEEHGEVDRQQNCERTHAGPPVPRQS